MNLLNGLREQLAERDRLYALLAVSIGVVTVLGMILFGLFAILPQIQTWQDKSAQLETAQIQLADVQQDQSGSVPVLRKQVESAQAELSRAASIFLSDAQAAQTLNRLYQYAGESSVTIVDLQNQPGLKLDDKGLYDVKTFVLCAQGTPRDLIDFISLIREASLQAFVITNLNLAAEDPACTLSMDIALYTSPYAAD